jgi:hypothetical protein
MPEDLLMTRDIIVDRILSILKEEFEIENPDLDENLTDTYEFDSIDAIALLEPPDAGGKKAGDGAQNHQSDLRLY